MKKNFNILNYFNMRALFFGMGISNILILAKETVWLSLIIGTILGIILLNCIKISIKKNFFNVLVSSTFIILCYIILINLISTMYMTHMPKLVIGLPILVILMYILNKRNIVIFRIANVLLFFNILFFIVSTLLLTKQFNIANFTYSNTPFKSTLLASLYYAILSVAPTLPTYNKEYKDYNLTKTYIISSITMSIVILLTYGILGSNLVEIYRYPEYIILKKITVLNFIENIENIVSFVWIFDIIMMMLSNGMNIKNNVNNKIIINIILVLIFIISVIINKYYLLLVPIYKYVLPICITCLVLLIIFNKHNYKRTKSDFHLK